MAHYENIFEGIELNNLDLRLLCNDQEVATSTSSVDNVEHIWFTTQQSGNLFLEINFTYHEPGITELEPFALSYRVTTKGIRGDFNLDKRVDFYDLLSLSQSWLMDVPLAQGVDLTGNAWVDFQDFAIFAQEWLKDYQF